MQDLRLINAAGIPIYPVVPNPYTLLSLTPFTVLDLKDAFFTIPLHSDSQDPFVFTWIDPNNHRSQQLTWTVLPQGFCDSPHFFDHTLASDLTSLDLIPSIVFQYVDDLLCSPLLTPLNNTLYNSSKSHLSRSPFNTNEKIYYYHRKSLIYTLLLPTSKTKILSLLGLAGYLCLWIPLGTTPISSHLRRSFRTPRAKIKYPFSR